MCLGIPGKIVEMVDPEHGIAKADVNGVRRNVNVQLLQSEGEDIGLDDWVLIHVGFAMSKIDEEEAEATFRFLEGLGGAYEQELEEMKAGVIE